MLSQEARERCVQEITSYFLDERDEEIGLIAAEDMLDFILQSIGPEIYNKAVEDSKGVLAAQLESMVVEMELLKRK